MKMFEKWAILPIILAVIVALALLLSGCVGPMPMPIPIPDGPPRGDLIRHWYPDQRYHGVPQPAGLPYPGAPAYGYGGYGPPGTHPIMNGFGAAPNRRYIPYDPCLVDPVHAIGNCRPKPVNPPPSPPKPAAPPPSPPKPVAPPPPPPKPVVPDGDRERCEKFTKSGKCSSVHGDVGF